jgi:hypothetical protein
MVYGNLRGDTYEPCGDKNNGFELLWNWGTLGAGQHNARIFADGVEIADIDFTVATLGFSAPYVAGLGTHTYTLDDFPIVGESTQVTWSEVDQNFTITGSTHQEASEDSGSPNSTIATAYLDRPNPVMEGDISFTYEGARYDTYYTDSPHWKITSYYGYMEFEFNGMNDFVYHALGSASQGVSYAYGDIYINGNLYESQHYHELAWLDHTIPASAFTTGTNRIRIVLNGATHIWISHARVVESVDSNNGPDPVTSWERYETFTPGLTKGTWDISGSTLNLGSVDGTVIFHDNGTVVTFRSIRGSLSRPIKGKMRG